MYVVADAVECGENVPSTSSKQTWHQPSKKLRTSAFVEDIKTPKASSKMNVAHRSRRDNFDPRPTDMRKKRTLSDYDLDSLADITNGQAAALLYASNFREEQSISSVPDLTMVSEFANLEAADIHIPTVKWAFQRCTDDADMLDKLSYNDESQAWLVRMTKEQSMSSLWHDQRRGRITASMMGKVLKHVDSTGSVVGATRSIVASIMGYYKSLQEGNLPKPLQWGHDREDLALKRYLAEQAPQHPALCIEKTGHWVSTEVPYVAASPDSLVRCSCCGSGTVEVKNPWTSRKLAVTDFAKQSTSCLVEEDGKVVLKKQHNYYSQIQTQLYCTNRDYCDFALMMDCEKDDFFVTRISRDVNFIEEMLKKCKVFFFEVVLSELRNNSENSS